jgi:hypothetical protein
MFELTKAETNEMDAQTRLRDSLEGQTILQGELRRTRCEAIEAVGSRPNQRQSSQRRQFCWWKPRELYSKYNKILGAPR